MRKTLAQAKTSTLPQAVGYAACDPRFLTLLNEAQDRLAFMGKWWGTYKRLRICVTAGCITWPQEVLTVEALTTCKYGTPIRNEWFEFQDDVRAPATGCDGHGACEERQLLDRGIVYQYRDFTALSTVRLYPALASDNGKRVLLQGNDANGNPIRTLDSVSGEYVTGEYVTLATPFAESVSEFDVPALTGVQKPLTNGQVTATSVAVVSGTETQIAIWGPSVLNPEYRRNYLTHWPRICHDGELCTNAGDGCSGADTSCTNAVVESIVRLKFIPAVVDSDWLFIENIEALKHMMRSIQKEDANLIQESEAYRDKAIRALRNELEAMSPKERTTINVLPFGTASPKRIFGGFI